MQLAVSWLSYLNERRNCNLKKGVNNTNYKGAKQRVKIMMGLFVLTCLFINGEVYAQQGTRLNAELAMPTLDVENGAKTYRERINTTAVKCDGAKLDLNLPEGFRYINESAKVGGVGLGEVIGGNNVTLTLLTSPADSPEDTRVT